jgi:hypothetical protein
VGRNSSSKAIDERFRRAQNEVDSKFGTSKKRVAAHSNLRLNVIFKEEKSWNEDAIDKSIEITVKDHLSDIATTRRGKAGQLFCGLVATISLSLLLLIFVDLKNHPFCVWLRCSGGPDQHIPVKSAACKSSRTYERWMQQCYKGPQRLNGLNVCGP